MTCAKAQHLQEFADNELPAPAHDEMAVHVAACAECSGAMSERLALKTAVRQAGRRYQAPIALHASVHRQLRTETTASRGWNWALAAAAVAVLAVGVSVWPRRGVGDALATELVDQHVIALSSPNPVDVISEDRHTVKPWFQGKLPFSFNLPELAGTDFVLLGGKVAYLQQRPAAELLYTAGRHKISVFVMEEGPGGRIAAANPAFNMTTWTSRGLRFYSVTDASTDESARLIALVQAANGS